MRVLSVLCAGFLILVWAGSVWSGLGPVDSVEGARTDSVTTVAGAPETVAVVDRGILYLYGNRMEPPYVFVMERDTVWVNGVQFIPPMRREPAPKVTVTRTDTLRHELNVRMDQEVFRLLGEGVVYDSIVARAAEIYTMSDLMDSLHVIEGTLELYWQGRGGLPDYVTIPRELPQPRPPRAEFLGSRVGVYASSLGRGSMVLRGERLSLTVSRGNVSKVKDQIMELKERGWATPEDERKFGKEGVEEFLYPLSLKGGERE